MASRSRSPFAEYQEDRGGGLICRQVSPGFGMSGKKNSFGRFRLSFDEIRAYALQR